MRALSSCSESCDSSILPTLMTCCFAVAKRESNQWEEAFSCWARATLKSSVENTDAGVTKEVQTLDFYIRQQRQWMPSTSANRILFQGMVYDITSVTPDFIRKDYLKLTATARKAGEANGNS